MKKKIAIPVFVVLMITIVALFIFSSTEKKPPDIVVSDIVFEEAIAKLQKDGYAYSAETKNATYHIPEDMDREKLVHNCEILIEVAKQVYSIEVSQPVIFFVPEASETNLDIRTIKVTSDNLSLFFQHIAGVELPTWFAKGLTSYWLNYYSDGNEAITQNDALQLLETHKDNAPPFGDAWLIPNLLENQSLENSVQVAESFVSYMQEERLLKPYIKSLSENESDAQSLLTSAWDSFAGSSYPIDSTYDWNGTDLFSVTTDSGIYTFHETKWKYSVVNDYITYIDKTIAFDKQFFDEYNELIPVEIYHNENKNGRRGDVTAFIAPNTVQLIIREGVEVAPMAHEVAHLLAYRTGVVTSKTHAYFMEGISTVFGFLYETENPEYLTRYYTNIYNNYPRFAELYTLHNGIPLASDGRFNYTALSDAEIFWRTEEDLSYLVNILEGDVRVVIPDLDTYEEATSFSLYLLNNYGLDKLMEAYSDFTAIEQIYKKSLDELIQDWKAYLGIA